MLIAAAVGSVAAMLGAVVGYSDEERAIRRAARRLPVTPVGLVRDGERARIVGRIVLAESGLAAPLSLRRCASYRIRMHAFQDSYGAFVEEERKRDFFVRDEAGALVWVRAAAARVVYAGALELQSGSIGVPEARLAAFLARHGQRARTPRGRKIRFVLQEGVLTPGDLVTVVGGARREIDPTGLSGSPRQPPIRLVLDAHAEAPLYILAGAARSA